MSSESAVRKLRAKIDHPVVDGDGHVIESWPLFFRYLAKTGGPELQDSFLREMREHPIFSTGNRERAEPRMPWWGTTTDTRDLATVMLPKLLYERLAELGLDFVILYPSLGLVLPTVQDEKVRRGALRALNTMNAEITAPYQDRMAAVAMIPMHSPEEALDEIDFATRTLGMKVGVIPAGVTRPIPALHREHPEAFPAAYYYDSYGIDSFHDYAPVWEAFRKHKLAVTAHGAPGNRYLPLPRKSTNYMFNHIMGHAYQQSELCLSLVMAGVPTLVPDLNWGFLEGGAGWACDLLHGLHEHFEKRGAAGIRNYDPSNIDVPLLQQLCDQHGQVGGEKIVPNPAGADNDPTSRVTELDEFALSRLHEDQDLAHIFGRQFFFGCEADDRSVYRGIDAKGNALGVRLRPFFSSDIGHWDVPRIGQVLLESHQLVDEGLLTDADYRDFVFSNPARLHVEMNPSFFDGTPVESAVKELLKASPTV